MVGVITGKVIFTPFIGAYAWITLLGRAGFITKLLASIGIQMGEIYGFKGIVLVFTLKLYPMRLKRVPM